MTQEVILRPAGISDWEKLSQLLTDAHLPLAGAQEGLHNFWLAFLDGELVGSIGLERYENDALLRSVAVAQRQRGQGVGTQLVQHALRQAEQASIQNIVLLTETARDFFLRFGFREIARAETPQAVTASIEFQSACPVSATVMLYNL